MIKIIINTPKKCPGLYSAFIQIPYNQNLIDIVKTAQISLYDKKTKIWEVDFTSLSKLIDKFTIYDDIELIDNIAEFHQDMLIDIDVTKLKTKPFDYQLEGINYGINHDKWLLLDSPGLGKTLQVIYIAESLKKQKLIEHCLIICGINTLKYNWKKEIEKHGNSNSIILGERINTRGKIVNDGIKYRKEQLSKKINEFFIIMNIETLRDDEIVKLINNGKNKIDMIVVDEIHHCKSPISQQGKNLQKLKNATYKIGLTGTLIMNSPLDSYVPLKWIGKEHSNYSTFKNYYIKYGGFFHNEIIGYKNTDVLKQEIAEVSLRRTKELLNLPEKTIIDEFVDMDNQQRAFYDNIVNGVFEDIDKVELDSNQVLSLVSRLRQATASPSMLTTLNIESSKIKRAVDLAEQIMYNKEKVVIFSIFKETLNQLNEKLKEFHPLICTGDYSDKEISNNIEKFQNDDSYQVLLATTQKMGTGVTLTAASYMIFIDCPWTAADCQQCEDRIHRIGSKNSVLIYYLWNTDTFDMQVKQIVQDKSLVEDYIIDNQINENFVERLKKLILDLKDS